MATPMATRSIVTSQPDVACDVCGRRLLRGEQPDVFLGGGRRRIVCELCSPRATHEGWLREADRHSVSLPHARVGRGRNLLERLRQLREGAPQSAEQDLEPYDFREEMPLTEEPAADLSQPTSTPTSGDVKIECAIGVFNAGEHPRRIAGVARSLGVPSVTVRALAQAGSMVMIVVAWELCWYRYEVDLGDEAAGAQAVAQGTELSELAAEDLLANAVAHADGTLSPAGA